MTKSGNEEQRQEQISTECEGEYLSMREKDGLLPLLKMTVDKGASDLHLKGTSPPVLRIDGALTPQEDWPAFTPEDIECVFEQVTTEEQRANFSTLWELDFAYSVSGVA